MKQFRNYVNLREEVEARAEELRREAVPTTRVSEREIGWMGWLGRGWTPPALSPTRSRRRPHPQHDLTRHSSTLKNP
jgi:hypothetical protein